MLDISEITEDFSTVVDRWSLDRMLRAGRLFRHKRVAELIAARVPTADNVFATTGREVCTGLDPEVDNIFA